MARFLTGAHAVGTASVLRPSHVHLSPAVGLIASSSRALLGNLHSIGRGKEQPSEWAPACALAVELFQAPRPGAPLRRTRSRSAAASHLTSCAAGHVLGLGLKQAPEECVTATLRDRCGIVSNRVDGVWTGVSLARFKRLVHLLSSDVSESIDLSSSSRGMCVPLFLQCVWERAESKRCILDFLLALDEHVGCLEPRWRDAFETDAGAVQEWCAETFKPGDTDESAVEMAARRVLHHQRAQGLEPFAHAVEVVAANLCDVHAFKPPNVLERHGYQGGEPRPDCVEMLLRELFDMLLFDPITQTFDVGRLPSSSAQALRDHFHRRNDGSLPPEYAGAEWFPLCQEHVPVCRYLSRTPDGSAYELYPSLSNLAAAAGVLLGQESRGWTSLSRLKPFGISCLNAGLMTAGED